MNRLGMIIGSMVRVVTTMIADRDTLPQRVNMECLYLGGIYIKFLQVLMVHESTKRFVATTSNQHIFETIAYEPLDIRRELESAQIVVERDFRSVEVTPFAAGSYGQVYRAVLAGGQDVVIKVLRPSVRGDLPVDLAVLRCISVVIGWFSQGSMLNFPELFREFSKATRAETDYIREVHNAQWLRQYFGSKGSLVIPKTYEKLSSRHIIVQEYIPGVSLAEVVDRQEAGEHIDAVVHAETGSDIWMQLQTLGIDMLSATLQADFLMVDPHPGNIRLLRDNKVALIDFGMVSKAPTNRPAFASLIQEFLKTYEDKFDIETFMLSTLAFYDTELYAAFLTVANEESGGGGYTTMLASHVRQQLEGHMYGPQFEQYVADRHMSRLFNTFINKGNALGIRFDEENALLQRSMAMYMALVRMIGERHPIGEPNKSLIHSVLEYVYRTHIKTGRYQSAAMPAMPRERAYEVLANWLALLAERDQVLYQRVMQERRV